MSFGKGAVLSGSLKHKINGKSSTDNEIISVDDFIGQILQTLYFMRAQGYEVEHNILFQDNHSSIRLLLNGRKSSTKQTKHMDVRFFFAKDVVNRGDMSIEYCPTEEMWADVMTKPLQGQAFRKMRSKIMNMPLEFVATNDKKVTVEDTKIAGVSSKKGSIHMNAGVSVHRVTWAKPLQQVWRFRKHKDENPPRHRKKQPASSTTVRRSVLNQLEMCELSHNKAQRKTRGQAETFMSHRKKKDRARQ